MIIDDGAASLGNLTNEIYSPGTSRLASNTHSDAPASKRRREVAGAFLWHVADDDEYAECGRRDLCD